MLRPAPLIIAVVLFGTACFNGKTVVQQRAAKEFYCDEAQVQVQELGGEGYRVMACGQQATYVCNPRAGMCMLQGVTAAPVRPQPGVAPGMPSQWNVPPRPGYSPYQRVPPGYGAPSPSRPAPQGSAPPSPGTTPSAGPPSPWNIPPAPGSSAFAW